MSERKNHKKPNALKHGVFAQGLILPGEDAKEFAELFASLMEEWTPQGTTECDAVLSIAKAMWRKKRLQKFRQAEVMRRMLDPADPAEHSYNGFFALSVFAKLLKLRPETAFTKLAQPLLRKELIDDFESEFPRSDYESEVDRSRALLEEVESRLKADSAVLQEDAVLSRTSGAFPSEDFKEDVMLEERLDALIDRAVKRLVQAKIAKELVRSSGSTTSPEGCPIMTLHPK